MFVLLFCFWSLFCCCLGLIGEVWVYGLCFGGFCEFTCVLGVWWLLVNCGVGC